MIKPQLGFESLAFYVFDVFREDIQNIPKHELIICVFKLNSCEGNI